MLSDIFEDLGYDFGGVRQGERNSNKKGRESAEGDP